MTTPNPEICEMCDREFPLTFHHLIPKSFHKRKMVQKKFTPEERQQGIWICRSCHSAIHRFLDHHALVREYHTLEALMAHEELAKFVAWSRHQRGPNKVHQPKS